MSRFVRTMAVLILVSLAGCGSHGGGTGARAEAARRLHEAAGRMRTAASFAFTADVTAGGRSIRLVGEFAAPDRVHETITSAGAVAAEAIFIGNVAYRRASAGGKWTSPTPRPTALQGEPRVPFEALVRVANVTATGDHYRVELLGADARILAGAKATRVTGTVVVADGTISVLDYIADDPLHTTTRITYAMVGSAPPVTAPPLG